MGTCMTLKVGSLVYDAVQGLGTLAKDFHDAGVVTHPVVVTRNTLKSRPSQRHWYPSAPRFPIRSIDRKQVTEYWQEHDVKVVLFFETPFEWGLPAYLRKYGIKSAIMPMHECMPQRWPCDFDLVINPSLLEQKLWPHGVFIPVPAAPCVPWRIREVCETFVYSGGWGGLKGRNGGAELLEAMKYVKSPAQFILKTQGDAFPLPRDLPSHIDVTQFTGTEERENLYTKGDCFVFPEKFNGLSLPLQEARAAGMLVMCGDRFPMNTWLPTGPLIPVGFYRKNRIGPPYQEFDEAMFDPRVIAQTIDEWYGEDISAYSESGKAWAEEHSWEMLKPMYLEELGSLT